MRCPYCGYDNPDIRLFCAKCGEILPEEGPSEAPQNTPAESSEPMEPAQETPVHELTPPEEETEFYRRRQRARRVVEEAWPEAMPAPQPDSLFDVPSDRPVRSDESPYARPEEPARRPVLEHKQTADSFGGRSNSYIPKRSEEMSPDDFFAVKGQVLPDYEEEQEPREERRPRYEEEDKQSFLARHMRGFVTLILLAITLLIVLGWLMTNSAQRMLAGMDLAWRAEPYAQLAEEAMTQRDFDSAGRYYLQALNHDEANLNYAVGAANAYISADNRSRAIEAVRKCIALDGTQVVFYQRLTELYSGYENMPAADRALVDKGYELTHDESLKH